jgi:hypothetical protein
MKINVAAALALALLATACGPNPAQKVIDPSQGSACPDDGPRLPETGICAGRASAYLEVAEGTTEPMLPEGCTWGVNETMLPDAALLYRAATCNGVTTKLAYAGGAHSASISYETSPANGAAAKGVEVIRLFGVDPDPQGALKGALAELPPAERARCVIEPAGIDGWPKDALVIRPNAATRAANADGPLPTCGPFGVGEDAISYWRVRQGFAWYFNLAPGPQDFDPASVTVIAKTADGGWGARP